MCVCVSPGKSQCVVVDVLSFFLSFEETIGSIRIKLSLLPVLLSETLAQSTEF